MRAVGSVIQGDFVRLRAMGPKDAERFAQLARAEEGQDRAEALQEALERQEARAFVVETAAGHLADALILGSSEHASLLVSPVRRASLEETEDTMGLLAAAAFSQPAVTAIVTLLDASHSSYGWILLRMGFEWLYDPQENARGTASVRLRRPVFESMAPWGGMGPC